MAQTRDPFLQVQADLLDNLDAARPLFQSYLRIRSTASDAHNPELREARTELEATLQDLSVDLADLVQSVKAVEKDHYRYGLEIEEVQRRRQLVQDVGREVEGMHVELKKAVEYQKNASSQGAALPHPSNFDSEDEGTVVDQYSQFEGQRQMEIMEEQDQALDGVFKTVGNLRMQADTMGRELEEQAVILDQMDQDVDRVGGKLQTGLKKVGYVIRKNEGEYARGDIPHGTLTDHDAENYSSCCIALLVVLLIILLIIVIAV